MIRLVIAAVSFAHVAPRLAGADASPGIAPADVEFFERKVRPVLVEHCYECHGDKKQKGGLRLDSRPGWHAGGDSGPVVTPGDPAKSLLIEAIGYKNEDLQMPPKEALGAAKVAILSEWVQRGAPDPRLTVPTDTAPKPIAMTLAQARAHWAFQPIVAPAIPTPRGLAPDAHPIDRFTSIAIGDSHRVKIRDLIRRRRRSGE